MSKLGNTKIEVGKDKVEVTFYDTKILVFDHERIKLNSGGHRTKTTKSRMNHLSKRYGLEFTVFQKKKEWSVEFFDRQFKKLVQIPFLDGMVIDRRLEK